MNNNKKIGKFAASDQVKFINRCLVYNLSDNSSFYADKDTAGVVVSDNDAGEIGSCQVKLKLSTGQEIIVGTNSKNLVKF